MCTTELRILNHVVFRVLTAKAPQAEAMRPGGLSDFLRKNCASQREICVPLLVMLLVHIKAFGLPL